MARCKRLRACADRGAAAVEFALVSIPLLLLVAGIIQFGFVFYSQITITQTAREGARLVSLQRPCDATCVSTIKTKMAGYGGSFVNPIVYDTFQTCAAGAKQDSEALVSVHYTVSVGLLFDVTVHGRASMPCGG
jgi:Flp pilus assembly protein TadG